MQYFTIFRSVCKSCRIKLTRSNFRQITYKDSCVYTPIQQNARALSLTMYAPSRHVSNQKFFRLSTLGIFPKKLINLGFATTKRRHLKGPWQVFEHTSCFKPNNLSIRFHTCKSRYHQEGTFVKNLSTNFGSNKYAQFGAFLVGFSLVSYSTLHFCFCDSDKLSTFFMQPVHASADFQRNNFIADVVEKAGPAVVFLEIKGR